MCDLISMSRDHDMQAAPTLFLLMAQYGGRATVPVERVVADFFAHLTPEKFLRKALRGEIKIPILRIERSQKAQRHIHLNDLAQYLDERRAAATRERDQLCGSV
jgi:hypothetical protein